jgi:hypothetical protein
MAAVVVLAGLTACSGTPAPAAPAPVTTTRATTPTHPTTSSTPPTPAFVTPAKVTAACPFVTVPEIAQAAGSSWAATAVEKPPQKGSFLCTYQSKFHSAAAFQLRILAPGGGTPRALADKAAKTCGEPAVPIPGTGDAAFYCQGPDQDVDGIPEQQTRIVVAKASHGESRVGVLDVHRIREDVYVSLAHLLAERL